ncbi:hypothetical protein DFJ58DRAFT_734075 [Suillus subalutaceus]|uniref:uncharacterized protein n=1 Tax=Suillus subalutaceus TaxID=48586 RepID=UPI001B86C1FA|nr:uncharacterized protein DFJ58DRAFT_734075 [Suillus subalutaceus]KAG1837978.1 hypothetical protein DFJ58DRAFT_734075 [Suillus subalutaceus]
MPTLQERGADLVWTEEQWRYAEQAVKMDSMDELVGYLEGLYADGIMSPSNAYIFIPNSLIRGHQLELRNNDGTLMAYSCVETALNQDLYELVKVIFGDLFQWIQINLQEYLPEEYELLEASARILLGNRHSPVLPFLSLVFNINVVTKGHRDGKDKHVCLVLPIGVFVGRELVMMETDLVVEVLQGDFIVASVVLHTDKAMDHWESERNSSQDMLAAEDDEEQEDDDGQDKGHSVIV